MSSRIILSALALGAVVVGGTLLLYRPVPLPATAAPVSAAAVPEDSRSREARDLNHNLRETPAARLADPGPLPPSLAGAHHGVQLRMDAQGNLLLQAYLVHLFDV